jgi:hypothetical protein
LGRVDLAPCLQLDLPAHGEQVKNLLKKTSQLLGDIVFGVVVSPFTGFDIHVKTFNA